MHVWPRMYLRVHGRCFVEVTTRFAPLACTFCGTTGTGTAFSRRSSLLPKTAQRLDDGPRHPPTTTRTLSPRSEGPLRTALRVVCDAGTSFRTSTFVYGGARRLHSTDFVLEVTHRDVLRPFGSWWSLPIWRDLVRRCCECGLRDKDACSPGAGSCSCRRVSTKSSFSI